MLKKALIALTIVIGTTGFCFADGYNMKEINTLEGGDIFIDEAFKASENEEPIEIQSLLIDLARAHYQRELIECEYYQNYLLEEILKELKDK